METTKTKTVQELYDDLAKTVIQYNPGADMGRIQAAFDCAERAHSGQKRKDGSPYVTHAIAAAQIAAYQNTPKGNHWTGFDFPFER